VRTAAAVAAAAALVRLQSLLLLSEPQLASWSYSSHTAPSGSQSVSLGYSVLETVAARPLLFSAR